MYALVLRSSILLILALVGPAAVSPARAASCNPDRTECRCGDTVTESVVLDADVEGCGDVGLRLRSGVTLDCNGHAIRGRSSREGILLQGIDGARVRNCVVEGFRFGIRVRAGRSHLISGNTVTENRRGISIGEETEDIRVEGNIITKNRDVGLLVNPGTVSVQVSSNQILDNSKRNIDVRSPIDLVLDRNAIGGRSSYDMRFLNVSDALVRANEFSGGRIQIRYDSDRNQFVDNLLVGREGFDFRGEETREGDFLAPDHNLIRGGKILGARRCFRFSGASYNIVDGVEFGACAGRPADFRTVSGNAAVGNVVEGSPSQDVPGDGTCGGDVECSCGDSASGTVRLSKDLVGCSRVGLKLGPGTTLDCNGHRIAGRQSDEGLQVRDADQVRIRNCRIENFEIGVQVRSSKSILIEDNEFLLNRKGVDVAGGSADISIEGNVFASSSDRAVAAEDGVDGFEIERNVFRDTRKNHVDLENIDEALISQNVFEGDSRSSLRLVDSKNNVVRGNVVVAGGIELRGGSTGNRFLENLLGEDGFRFDGIEERSGPWRFPNGNRVEGGAVTEARRCFYIRGASDNVFKSVRLGECRSRPFELKSVDGHVPTGNVLID